MHMHGRVPEAISRIFGATARTSSPMETELRVDTITLTLALDLTLVQVQRQQVTNKAKIIVNKLSWLSKQTGHSVKKVLGRRSVDLSVEG